MNTPTNTAAITRRQLTHVEIFNLCTWYKENQTRLLTITDAEVRMEAEKTLQITGLNDSHITGVRRTLGIEKRRKPAPPNGDVEALECLVNEQADKLASLMGTVQGLLDRVRKLETTR